MAGAVSQTPPPSPAGVDGPPIGSLCCRQGRNTSTRGHTPRGSLLLPRAPGRPLPRLPARFVPPVETLPPTHQHRRDHLTARGCESLLVGTEEGSAAAPNPRPTPRRRLERLLRPCKSSIRSDRHLAVRVGAPPRGGGRGRLLLHPSPLSVRPQMQTAIKDGLGSGRGASEYHSGLPPD